MDASKSKFFFWCGSGGSGGAAEDPEAWADDRRLIKEGTAALPAEGAALLKCAPFPAAPAFLPPYHSRVPC